MGGGGGGSANQKSLNKAAARAGLTPTLKASKSRQATANARAFKRNAK